MRWKTILPLTLLAATAFGAQIPRKSPEFGIQTPDGKQVLVSAFRGKVLCLVFILTT